MDNIFLNHIFQITIFLFIIIQSQSRGILDYSHDKNSKLQIQAGALSSINNIIPFSYKKLNICDVKKIKKGEDNLGELLTGEKIFNTEYSAYTAKNTLCNTLCLNKFDEKTTNTLKELYDYVDTLNAEMNLYVNNEPFITAAVAAKRFKATEIITGFPKDNGSPFIYGLHSIAQIGRAHV